MDLGVDGIELDVHLSLDGEVIVIHDDTVDRTTSQKGWVKDFSAKELKLLGIPTLESVLDLVDKYCFVNIELKTYKTLKLFSLYLTQIIHLFYFK